MLADDRQVLKLLTCNPLQQHAIIYRKTASKLFKNYITIFMHKKTNPNPRNDA